MTDRETVRELVNNLVANGKHSSAIKLMKRYCAGDEEFLDQIISRYLKKARSGPLLSLNHEWVYRAEHLLPMGPSMKMREEVLRAFVEMGAHRIAQQVAATHLHRKLTREEVNTLIDQYLNDACSSSTQEEELLALALHYGGDDWRKKTALRFAKRKHDGCLD